MSLFPPPSNVIAAPESPGLPPLPQPLKTDRPIRWLGDDGKNVFIEIQGQLACVAVRKGPLSYERKKRAEINGFSAASRLRLFKTINRLEFERAGRCTFVTATWRDELGRPEPGEITRARSNFQKSIERMAEKELPGVWRVEWQLRKSGEYKDEYMPHLHVIYFKIPFLEVKDVGKAWARAIGTDEHVSVKMNEIKEMQQCMYYIGKYVAKIDFDCNLDIPSYLGKQLGGRKWGIYRKNEMPFADRHEIRVAPGELVEKIRSIAIEAWDKTPQHPEEGFTVFGPRTRDIQEIVDQWCLQLPD